MGNLIKNKMLSKSAMTLALSTMLMTETEGRISFGSCPEDLKMMANFDKTKYVGKWYEIVRDPTNPFPFFSMCVTMEFSQIKSDGSFDQMYRGLFWPVMYYGENDGVYY